MKHGDPAVSGFWRSVLIYLASLVLIGALCVFVGSLIACRVCKPLDARCYKGNSQLCRPDGRWETVVRCTRDGRTCELQNGRTVCVEEPKR